MTELLASFNKDYICLRVTVFDCFSLARRNFHLATLIYLFVVSKSSGLNGSPINSKLSILVKS